jgi:rubrerythrin
MSSIKGSKTEQNLLKAFAGESQARNRYEFAAKAAKKEGLEQIAALFQETADQEKQHAKRFFSFLEGGALQITAAYPAGITGHTAENLKMAAAGEHEEWTELYPAFAATAREEGFEEVAISFEKIAKVEEQHELRYQRLLNNLDNGVVFEKEDEVYWMCRNCGYIHKGKAAPEKCPACLHPKAYFELKKENY